MSVGTPESGVPRGPEGRAKTSPSLYIALRDGYGIGDGALADARDLGGSSSLNLLFSDRVRGRNVVVRVHRAWVTAARLADMQLVRRRLADGGVPCVQPIPTLTGQSWLVVDDRLVEVEPFVEHDANMDSWQRLELGLPWLGRIHTLLRPLQVSEDGRNAPADNNIEPQDALPGTVRGVRRMRRWPDASPSELQLASVSEELAHLVDCEQRKLGLTGLPCEGLPRQLVHGDFWDNNVLFRDDRAVLIADLDFMGERARVDDLALTLYYTNSTFSDDQTSDARIRRLRTLVDAYDAGLDDPLTTAERAAVPLALARAPLAFIAMIAAVDTERGARRLAAEMTVDVGWALAIMRDLGRWQSAFA